MSSKDIVTQWARENRTGLDRCIRRAIEAFDADHSIRVPRRPEERLNQFAAWLARVRPAVAAVDRTEFENEFPNLTEKLRDPAAIQRILDQHVWAHVEEDFRRWAVRSLALAWTGRHIGDAVAVGWPDRADDHWRVPLCARDREGEVGQVMLDLDGSVLLPASTSSRDEIIQLLDGRARTTAPAAARQ